MSSAPWALVLLQVVVIFFFAKLLPQATWLADEYTQIGGLEGAPSQLHVFLERLNWSPRPLSEFVLFLYDEVVIYTHHSFAGLFSAVIWIAFFIVTCFGAIHTQRSERATRIAIPLLFFILCALRSQSFEILLWPAGVAPYLLTIAFMLALVLDFIDTKPNIGIMSSRQPWLLVGMTLSSEVGMIFAGLWAAGCGLYELITAQNLRQRLRVVTALIPLAIAGGLVVGLSLTGRMRSDASSAHAKSSMQQFRNAFHQVVHDYTVGPAFTNPYFHHHLANNLILEGVFFAGVCALFASRVLTLFRSRAPVIVTIASAIGTQLLVTFLSLRNYGGLTDRHQAVCLFLTFLTLFSVAAIVGTAIAQRRAGAQEHATFAYPILVLCVAYLGLKFVPLYTMTLQDQPAILADRATTWAQGWNGNNAITFRCKQSTAFIPACPTGLPSGTYPIDVDTDWQVRGIMWFFHKTVVTIQKY